MKKIKLLTFFAILFFIGLTPTYAITWRTSLTKLQVSIDSTDEESVEIYFSTDNTNFDLIATLTQENRFVEVPIETCKTYYLKVYGDVNEINSTCLDPSPEEPDDPDTPVEPSEPTTPEKPSENPEEPITPENNTTTPQEPQTPIDNSTNNTTPEQPKENPETGSFISYLSLTILALFGAAILKFKKKKYFN